MTRAPTRAPAPKPAGAPPVAPVVPSATDPMDLVAGAAQAAAERISLSPEVTSENVSRMLMSDQPLGFEDMALQAQGRPTAAIQQALPEPAVIGFAPEPPLTNEAGVSQSVLDRTTAEQEAGRAAVARRTAESVRNREITARENAKRLAEGSAAEAGDLSYTTAD